MPITEQESVAALPPGGWLRRYVAHAARQTTSPIGYHIGVGLTTLAVTCPLAYGMHYAGVLRANNFCLLVGRSGEDNKSSALHVAREILDAAAAPLIGDFPGSPEGLIESLANVPSQLIPISEFGKFLSSAQHGYFEPTKTLLADLWDCGDSSTEILSESGWRRIGTISKGEKVYALDSATDRLVLSAVLDTGVRQVRSGEQMAVLRGISHDVRVTEGHRIYFKYRDPSNGSRPSKNYLIKTAKQMATRKSSFLLPFSAQPQQDFAGLPLSDDQLRFTAWTISQSEHLASGIKESCLESLKGMSIRQFRLFWHELLLGHGEQVRGDVKGLLWSVDASLVDWLQHMAVIRGFSTQYATRVLDSGKIAFRLSITEKRLVATDPGNKKSIRFEMETPNPSEQVWCISTEHQTIVTRRNGKVVILGNCLPTQRARANNKIIRVDDPRLSITAACSIPYLEKHTLAEDWTGGFMGRWMVVYARRERTDPDPIGDRTDFQWLVDELQRRAMTQTAGWCTGMDGGAKRFWNDWFNDISNRQLPNNIIGIRARAPTICRKICLMYGWDYGPAIHGQPWRIDISILEPAIAFTELHVRSLIDLSNMIAEHSDARLRRSVLMAIDQHGGVATLGEILAVLKMRKRMVVEHLDALIEEKTVAKVDTTLGHAAFEHRRTL